MKFLPMLDLINYSYYICLVLFILLSAAVLYNFTSCSCLFKGINRKAWAAIAALLIFSFCIRVFSIPHRHYVFYDEYEHINAAKNMAETRQFSRCDFYLDNRCLSSSLPQWLPGYHFLLSSVFKIFGVNESNAYNFNAFLGTASILLLFLLTYLITLNGAIALISALLLAFSPLHLAYSGNSSLEMCSFVFLLLSSLSLLMFMRLQTKSAFFLLLAALAYTVQIRAENGAVVLLVFAVILLDKIDLRKFSKSWYLLILFLPYLFYLPGIKTYMDNSWLCYRGWLSLSNLFGQNIWFWFNSSIVPLVYSLSAVLGAYSLRKSREKFYIFLSLYFLALLFIYTFLHKLDVSIGDTQRYNLLLYFPVVIFASVGLFNAFKFLYKARGIRWVLVSALFFALLFNLFRTYQSSQSFKNYRDFDIFQEQHREFMRGKEIDPGCVFISYNPPSVITTLGRSSVNPGYSFNDEIYDRYLKARCLVLVNDFWCQKDSAGMCAAIKNKYTLERVESKNDAGMGLFYYLRIKK